MNSFYEQAAVLDEAKAKKSPMVRDVRVIVPLLREPKFSKYFFEDLQTPEWILPLYEEDVFLILPDPVEDPNKAGFYSLPSWHAGKYLHEFAEQYPDVVKQVALKVETTNSRVHHELLKALLRIPATEAAKTVSRFADWASGQFSYSMMLAYEMSMVMGHLAKGNEIDAGLQVLSVLTQPKPMQDGFDKDKTIAASALDLYWVRKGLSENLQTLIEKAPIRTLELLGKQLRTALMIEIDENESEEMSISHRYWRLNIQPRSGRHASDDLKDLLVDEILKLLEGAPERKHGDIERILRGYLESEHVILKRIALYIMRLNGDIYSDLALEAYTKLRDDDFFSSFNEFERFVDARFAGFPSEVQVEVLERVEEETKNEGFISWMEGQLKNYPDSFAGDALEDKRTDFLERWLLKEFRRFKGNLPPIYEDRYKDLLTQYPEPGPPVEEGFLISSGIESEEDKFEDLSTKAASEVFHYLKEYVDPRKGFDSSREALARQLNIDVEMRPQEYLKASELLLKQRLPFVYIASILSGLSVGIKNSQLTSLKDLLPLMNYVVRVENGDIPEPSDGSGLQAAQGACAQILEEALKQKNVEVEENDYQTIESLITQLLEKTDPLLEDDFPNVDQISEEFDPVSTSINSIKGEAMHALILYGLFRSRKEKEAGRGKLMVAFLRELLEKNLDKSVEPSLTIHTVYGWYWPQLVYLDEDWSDLNQRNIFPLEKASRHYFSAAWNGYIAFSDVYNNVFPKMRKEYTLAIEEMNSETKNQPRFGSVNERLVTHILKAYLFGLIDLYSDDKLLSLLYEKADDDSRAGGAFWLSQVLGEKKRKSEDTVWLRIRDFWKWRLQNAKLKADKSIYRKEIASYTRLLANAPIDLAEAEPLINQMLEFEADGFELHEIVKYLAQESEKHPDSAVSVLRVIFEREFYMTTSAENSMKIVLENGVENATQPESRLQIKEIVNILGERGEYKWRYLLESV